MRRLHPEARPPLFLCKELHRTEKSAVFPRVPVLHVRGVCVHRFSWCQLSVTVLLGWHVIFRPCSDALFPEVHSRIEHNPGSSRSNGYHGIWASCVIAFKFHAFHRRLFFSCGWKNRFWVGKQHWRERSEKCDKETPVCVRTSLAVRLYTTHPLLFESCHRGPI